MGGRILIVEDTAHNMQLMTYLLEAHGHTVVPAGTGEEAIELFGTAAPDLVVMDLQLPGIDGYQALSVMRATPVVAAVPVVAVTSFAMVGDRDRAIEAGFDHYLTKPIDPETFSAEIASQLPEELRGIQPMVTGTFPSSPAETISPARRSGGEADILVLDDSLTNQTLLRSVLEPHGYQVRTAFTVKEAITAAEHKSPDLVLSDVHVGAERGIDLLAHLTSVPELAVVPFAFLTATADWLEPLVRDGTARIIRRPIEPTELLDEITALLATRVGT